MSDRLVDQLWAVGSVEEVRERLIEQDEAGVDLHSVVLSDVDSPAEAAHIYEALQK